MGAPARRGVARPRLRRRLTRLGLGLVLLPTLALAALVHEGLEAERQARAREQARHQERLQQRAVTLARTLARHPEVFPEAPAERFALGLDHPEIAPGVRVDGRCDDWRHTGGAEAAGCEAALVTYDRAELLAHDAGAYDPRDLSLSLAAAREAARLHLFARVVDDQLAPRGRRLDEADHLRLAVAVPESSGGAALPQRFVVALGPEGEVTTYAVERDWRSEAPARRRGVWGDYRLPATRRPYGRWRATPQGYDLELRLPLRTLGAHWREAELGLAVVDVDVRPERADGLARRALWMVPLREGALALQSPDAPRFQVALEDLALELGGRDVAVLDARGRELFTTLPRAPEGGAQPLPIAERGRAQTIARGGVAQRAAPHAAAGPRLGGGLRERVRALERAVRLGDEAVATTREPAVAAVRVESPEGRRLGVVVELDASGPPPPALASVVSELPLTAAALAATLGLLLVLLGTSRRLSRRILALVDDVGADQGADDEIGELSRRLSELVARDRAHREYLEQLPRILGHETLGPLGVVKMALDELPASDPRRASAGRAVRSIEELIEDLREATSLEEALEKGERIQVDLVAFVREYAAAWQEASDARLSLSLPGGAFRIEVVERRIEQLLDKLLDNAVAFSDGSPVALSLACRGDEACLRVANRGSQLPPGVPSEQLFAPMASWRKRTTERHLGLGLYVARVIAEQHGGGLRAWNDTADSVAVEARLRRSR